MKINNDLIATALSLSDNINDSSLVIDNAVSYLMAVSYISDVKAKILIDDFLNSVDTFKDFEGQIIGSCVEGDNLEEED